MIYLEDRRRVSIVHKCLSHHLSCVHYLLLPWDFGRKTLAMDYPSKSDGSSMHRAEDVDVEEQKGPIGGVIDKGADRAVNLIGDQHIELTEEDVST